MNFNKNEVKYLFKCANVNGNQYMDGSNYFAKEKVVAY